MLVRHRTDSPWRTWGIAPGMRLRGKSSAKSAIHFYSQSQTYLSSKSTPCLRSNSRYSSWKVRVRWFSCWLTLRTEHRPRLSFSQRERMKVRVCFVVAPQVQTRLLATRYRAPGEPDDSRIATHRLHGEPGIVIACDREFGLHGSYVHRHPIRWPALRWDNKNPRRSLRMDAAGEIYGMQNPGSANAAKECVQAPSPCFAAIERDPQTIGSNH